MASIASLVLKIVSDVSGAQKGLEDTATAAQKVEGTVGNLAIPAAAAAGAVLLLGKNSADAASDVEQSFGALESVYKDQSDSMKKLARDAATTNGLSSAEYANMASVIGAQLKSMGKSMDELGPQTDDLINLGADLAATYGGTTSEAVSALSALLRGERDPIERYGVSLKQADVDAQLLATGIKTAKEATADYSKAQAAVIRDQKAVEAGHMAVARAQIAVTSALKSEDPARIALAKSTLAHAQATEETAKQALVLDTASAKAKGAVTGLSTEQMKAATANATLALLTKQTADATGQFSRESDTAAHAQQVATAEWTNAQAAIGEALLPAVIAISHALSAFSAFATENKGAVLALGAVILTVAGAVLAINVAFKLYRTAVLAAQAAQWLLNAAQSANPLGIILIAVMALVAAIVLLWQHSETFRTIVTTVFNAVLAVIKTVVAWITSAFNTLAGILAAPFNTWLSVVQRVIGTIKGLFNGLMGVINHLLDIVGDLGRKVSGVLSNIPKLPFSLAAPPATAPPVPGLRGVQPLSAIPAGGGGATNVTMVLDREVFGRALISGLRRYDRRNGAPQVLPRWS